MPFSNAVVHDIMFMNIKCGYYSRAAVISLSTLHVATIQGAAPIGINVVVKEQLYKFAIVKYGIFLKYLQWPR